jgi:hypothetical protein
MEAVVAFLLIFAPVIVYAVRNKEYEIPVLVPFALALFFGSGVAGLLSSWAFGKDFYWLGLVGVWAYAMYKAFK